MYEFINFIYVLMIQNSNFMDRNKILLIYSQKFRIFLGVRIVFDNHKTIFRIETD